MVLFVGEIAREDRWRRAFQEVDLSQTFADLAKGGVVRNDLQLAWDFTIASTQSLTAILIEVTGGAPRVIFERTFTTPGEPTHPNVAICRANHDRLARTVEPLRTQRRALPAPARRERCERHRDEDVEGAEQDADRRHGDEHDQR